MKEIKIQDHEIQKLPVPSAAHVTPAGRSVYSDTEDVLKTPDVWPVSDSLIPLP